MAFCPNCGNELDTASVFCPNCGQKTGEQENGAQANNPTTSAPATNTQRVDVSPQTEISNAHMVLNGSKKEGFIKSKTCYMVFFNDRIVFSFIGKERMNAEIKRAQEQVKAEGKGFFKGAMAMMNFWTNYGSRYYQMNPVEIEREDGANFTVYNREIEKIMFRTVDRKNQNAGDDSSNTGFGDMVIYFNNAKEKIKVKHRYNDSNKNIKKVLEMLLGNRLKYKGALLSIHIGGSKDGFN